MVKKCLKVTLLVIAVAALIGCATKKAYMPVDVSSNAKAAGLVQCTDNAVVVFDRSDSMNPWYDRDSKLAIAKRVTSEMAQTIPASVKLSPSIRLFGAEKVGSDESTWLVTGADFQKAMDKIGNRGLGRTPMGRALAAAGDDVKGLSGKSAIILVSDFEQVEGIDDLRPKSILENVAKLKADYGDKVCIYSVQVGKDVEGKKLAEQIVADGGCGFVENADNLQTPAAMAAYVQKVFFCPPPARAEEKAAVVPPPPPIIPGVDKLGAVYFDFDKYELKPEARATLKKNADWLSKNPDKKVVVEGNCDERGTNEYNMALGQRRAEAAAKYLKSLGVGADRISTISYGEDRPLCKESNEVCWSKNRRDDFIIK
jgi:peptidoglycan-associated lipoprotein